jgi:regulatory protein RepA
MNDSNYILLLSNGNNFRPLNEKFAKLNGFYNGIGYAFPVQHESLLRQIVDHLPGVKIYKMPMEPHRSFESFRQSHNASYFLEKLIRLEEKLSIIKSKTKNETEEAEYIIHLTEEKEKLIEAIEWSRGMEKALLNEQASNISIQFICEQKVNFLLDEAPFMPRLVNLHDGGNIRPLIRKGIVGMLVGAGGVGKTHALAQLSIAIATGDYWLGKYPVEKKGYVFLGLGENCYDDIHRLLRKIVRSLSEKKELTLSHREQFQEASHRMAVKSFTGINATFIQKETPTEFYYTFLNELKSKEPQEGWSCIILDPISRFLGSDAENDNASATRFISLLEHMSLELRGHPTILFGHHMNKMGVGSINTNQTSARGSSAITDGVRWQANLEKATEDESNRNKKIILKVVKTNFTSYPEAALLEKDDNGILFIQDPNKPFYK